MNRLAAGGDVLLLRQGDAQMHRLGRVQRQYRHPVRQIGGEDVIQ